MPALSPTAYVGQRIAEARAKASPTRLELSRRPGRSRNVATDGITQFELARRIGLTGDSKADISRLESGTHEPRLGKLLAIAEALGVPVESLLPV